MEFNVCWDEKRINLFKKIRLVKIFHKDIFKAKDFDDFGNRYEYLLDQVVAFDTIMETSGVKTVWMYGKICNGETQIADIIGIFAVEEM
jgi:hypothetical protein